MSDKVTIAVEGSGAVSGLFDRGAEARACLVLAHGAGAGMDHPFMTSVAKGLSEAGIATLRYNFPYMEAKSRRPDRPPVAVSTVRAAVAEAARLAPGLTLVAGGKSFGGRMTSTAEAEAPLGVHGLVFFGFPLHPPGKPSDERAAHLAEVSVPMLFLQGTRDTFAELDLLEPLCQRLAGRAMLHLFEDGDHSFHVRKASGRTDADVLAEMVVTTAAWIDGLI